MPNTLKLKYSRDSSKWLFSQRSNSPNLSSHQPDQGPEDEEDEAEAEAGQTNQLELRREYLSIRTWAHLLLSPAFRSEVEMSWERDYNSRSVEDKPGDGECPPPLTASA